MQVLFNVSKGCPIDPSKASPGLYVAEFEPGADACLLFKTPTEGWVEVEAGDNTNAPAVCWVAEVDEVVPAGELPRTRVHPLSDVCRPEVAKLSARGLLDQAPGLGGAGMP